MQNRTDIRANQTLDYVQSGFLNLENALQEAFIHYKYNSAKFSTYQQTKEFPIKGNNSLLSSKYRCIVFWIIDINSMH
jgi:hypothetical protein